MAVVVVVIGVAMQVKQEAVEVAELKMLVLVQQHKVRQLLRQVQVMQEQRDQVAAAVVEVARVVLQVIQLVVQEYLTQLQVMLYFMVAEEEVQVIQMVLEGQEVERQEL